ncbi:hypothetical protein [Corynebacterium mayonis]|uniref:hypothetical protein n=1 Tax=Corynebacterium mayonis TaxID=3062461 RepID=UPI0031405B13
MNRRSHEGEPRDAFPYLQPVVDDDAFLTALSRGEDPSGGEDELASLLLRLREDVERPLPQPPEVAGVVGAGSGVASLDEARLRRRVSPWTSGVIGAAAATVAVVGTGAALYGATPGSPLWGVSTAVFGERETVVELASTLDNLEAANASGDEDTARQLLEQARVLVDSMQKEQPRSNTLTQTTVETTSVTVPGSSEVRHKPDAETGAALTSARKPLPTREVTTTTEVATVTEVMTVTVTVTPSAQPSTPKSSGASPEPSSTSVANSRTDLLTGEPTPRSIPEDNGPQVQMNSSHG